MKTATFSRGVHPHEYKELTSHKPIEKLPAPESVFIPLQQHIGKPCKPLVAKGDTVTIGQKIGDAEELVTAPVHASISGAVKSIGHFPHPLGGRVEMIHIQNEPPEASSESEILLDRPTDWENASPTDLIRVVREAGIVGMGGAGFPAHVKLNPPPEKPIDTFILNGCECEPYLTADHRMMVENTDEILVGMAIICKILGNCKGYIGIEKNKPDAIQRMQERVSTLNYDFTVVPLDVKYPQGAEKMLIQSVLKRKVPAGGLPLDVGVVVHNVGTTLAIHAAVINGKPVTQRVVTVTGDGLRDPKNILAPIGTPFQDLLNYGGESLSETKQVFMGGPMMGLAQYDLSVPVVKTTSGIVSLHQEPVSAIRQMPCIQCGNCVSACPMNLIPTRLARYTQNQRYTELIDWGVFNCIECGSCAFVCPSAIPLVQWIRVGKNKARQVQKSAS
ncbi:MAG: electron transport complex subunit RsxC [Lentisphaeria bacterium]|nr:electron transport complex subunit RsxC [Candidatus Neomarinimicrobiota bacterium]MCF7841759.1 electron transport complex subunit RsxC [Lentisphaeria bacterium]